MNELLTQSARRAFLDVVEEHDGKRHLAFVYGTLMRGYTNNWNFLQDADTKFLGIATTVLPFSLVYSSGEYGFPVAMSSMPEGTTTEELSILGELYEVSSATIASMDRLEGEGYMYDRTAARVVTADSVTHDAQMYIGNYAFWGKTMPWAVGCPIEGHNGARCYKWKRGEA